MTQQDRETAYQDALAMAEGRYNRELYDRLADMADGMKPLTETWRQADRVAVLEVCTRVYGPMPPAQMCQFMQGFQLANAYAARYGPIPEAETDKHA